MAKRAAFSSIISETVVSVIKESVLWRAPRKSLNADSKRCLHKVWDFEESVKWGYHFNCANSEVAFFHLSTGGVWSWNTECASVQMTGVSSSPQFRDG